MSIHPDAMNQQINFQRERARSICLAAITDDPLANVPEEEHSHVRQTRIIPKKSRKIHPAQTNSNMEALSVYPQNGAMNGEQLRKAYKMTQLQRQNTNDITTRL